LAFQIGQTTLVFSARRATNPAGGLVNNLVNAGQISSAIARPIPDVAKTTQKASKDRFTPPFPAPAG
jgi:hypothetical protein